MNAFQLVLRNLWFHRRMHAAVALGVLAATAVLTGALLVGDSMRGSLRHLTLDRLGRIDEILVTPHFFTRELADQTARHPAVQEHFDEIVPALFVPGTFETTSKPIERAGGVNVLGCEPEFWKLGADGPQHPPALDEVVLNETLAEALGLRAEQLASGAPPVEVILRIGEASQIPADSPLGRKTDTIRTRRLKVTEIIPARGLGRFGLRPNQQLPRNAYVATETLQAMLEQPGRVNALLVAGKSTAAPPGPAADQALVQALHPQLTDYGLSLKRTKHDYFNLTSDRMLLEPTVAAAALKAFAADHPQPVLTYLANYILAGPNDQGKIPYSTISGVDFTAQPPLGPIVDLNGQPIPPLNEHQIVLNAWTANDLKQQGVNVQVGDPIKLVYFEPESTHGQIKERTVEFKLAAIAAMEGSAVDPDFTPELKHVTDEASIANWNPPFPYFPDRVRTIAPNDQDDRYWKEYKATPKGFISLAAGRRLWGSRFGDTTSIRVPATAHLTAAKLADALQLDPAALGFQFMPVKRWGLQAASGTTPFGLLFLGFSLFIIAAAIMLIVLLFRLGIEQRAKEIGLLAAVGWSFRKIRRVLLAEGAIVALVGAALGVLVGIGYAWLMLVGLKTWWLGAVTTPFLTLYLTPTSLLIGFVAGEIVACLTILFALRRLHRVSVRRLLEGQATPPRATVGLHSRRRQAIALALAVLAIGLGLFAGRLSGEAQAGAFFTAGALVLAAALMEVSVVLRGGRHRALVAAGQGALVRLAVRNGGRNPGRSTLTIGLVAAASFLIVAIGAFHLEPPAAGPQKESGNGGYALIGETDQPVFYNLNAPAGQQELGVSDAQAKVLREAEIIPLRVQAGDDASCLNLFQPRQPRLLGMSPEFIERGGFEFSASAARTDAEQKNPWLLLQGPAQDAVPVIMDENTALYSLHLGDFMNSPIGKFYEIDNGRGGKLKLQVVGLLQNSIFQGELLISEAALVQDFPDVSGYRSFLIATDAPRDDRSVTDALVEVLGDYGFRTETTASKLAQFMIVQNTYLSTFQSLGALGLLLGTFGLATVQLRNVFERRGELALLRAIGFRRARLAAMVTLENASLLVLGLLAGIVAALVAVWPHLFGGGATLPWKSLGATLAIVLVVGLLAGLAAVRATLKAPLIGALREE
ncbi:MAG TPA: FtsX-like permease family protein [Pirellulales bacterium]|jgi:ABC-type antimicrobial peptide transport system permease subunit|nr:FtsX-like permease family protein [Pirellulales bacterium]